jgi:hypothetical protein
MTAHWGVPDQRLAGQDRPCIQGWLPNALSAHWALHGAADPSLDQLSFQQRLKEIGRMHGATAKAKEPT